ncbi:MAG: TonB-dependent receptor plug domain-containing protein [Opitutaceae bacterium]
MVIRLPACARSLTALLIIALASPGLAFAQAAPNKALEEITVLEKFVTSQTNDDPDYLLPTQPVESAFGFSKTLLETPRSSSLISGETIERFSLSAVEDLARVVPGVFTTTRFGIQGGIDVRNVPADTYFRGMRRLSLQGNARSVLAAMDSIEVVKGPPSPIFGMGKIGGYTNATPKSGRAKTGKYLAAPEGFLQAIVGSYSRNEASFGVGGPVELAGRKGGYYVYGLVEDSESFAKGVPIKQEIAQASLSLDDVLGGLRLESGMSLQVSRTAGALTGRFTQDLVDTGRYIRGSALVNLDLNGSGVVGIREMFRASPVTGTISGNNLPLIQTFPWPLDSAGKPLPLGSFPKVKGIPLNMFNYLVANPSKDPSGLLRAQGIGGPRPGNAQVPVGMVLDPTTVGYDTLDRRRSAAFERNLRAELVTGYFDLIYDRNPDFTVKNQIFFDSMDQYKISNQPFSPKNDVLLWENKLTAVKRLTRLPDWVAINSLASVNFRYTRANTKSSGGDYGTHRSDAMAATWVDERGGMTPNTTFANPFENADPLSDDSFPWTAHGRTSFTEAGVGAMLDIDLLQKTNFIIGGRWDSSQAKNWNYAGVWAIGGAGTSNANPLRQINTETSSRGTDDGVSWSASLSQQLPFGLRPYLTLARSSLALDGSDNRISDAIIAAGHIGSAELKEAGVKASFFKNTVFVTASVYKQTRIILQSPDEDPAAATATAGAFASSTTTTGEEFEVKWVPIKRFFVTAYALQQETEFIPNSGGTMLVDARTLGFQDVVDPTTGKVVYPAEAFLYGGRSRVTLPDKVDAFKYKSGNPRVQAALSTGYTLRNGFGFTINANYLSAVDTGRLGIVRLPLNYIFNTNIFWGVGKWNVKLDLFNALNERYFKPRTGDTLGDALAQAMPGRRWQLTLRRGF